MSARRQLLPLRNVCILFFFFLSMSFSRNEIELGAFCVSIIMGSSCPLILSQLRERESETFYAGPMNITAVENEKKSLTAVMRCISPIIDRGKFALRSKTGKHPRHARTDGLSNRQYQITFLALSEHSKNTRRKYAAPPMEHSYSCSPTQICCWLHRFLISRLCGRKLFSPGYQCFASL